MAKILFNDELFNISEAALNAASERIMRVLSSVMNGTGATINFGGTTYNIDSTKLSTITNSFVSHLGTVSGSGMKVSVGGVEYNIDSSKMSNAVSQIHEVLRGLHSDGDDSGLEMNEYGFYFGQKYTYCGDGNEMIIVFFEDGSTKVTLIVGGEEEVIESPAGTAVYGQNKAEIEGDVCTFFDNGTKFEMDGAIFVMQVPGTTHKYDDTYPIEWNTMEVVGNSSFVWPDIPFVKISNITPSKSDLLKLTLVIKMNGQNIVQQAEGDTNLSCAVIFRLGDKAVICMSISEDIINEFAFLANAETGLYLVDIYTMTGINADCRLELSPPAKDPALNPVDVKVVDGAYSHGDYIYYAQMNEGHNSFGAATLEEAWEIVYAQLADMGVTYDMYVAMQQQEFENNIGMTWEEYAKANGITGSFEDMAKAQLGLTEDTFVPCIVEDWNVIVTDTTKTEYGAILESINGAPVISLHYTFCDCTNLVSAPAIPNSVTDMDSTFAGCTNLTSAPVIPNSVTNMSFTFYNCTNLTSAPVIPNSVTNMNATFYQCTNLITPPDMSNANSVTDMKETFHGCTSLTSAPVIPSGVTNMSNTFSGCDALTGTVEIHANPTKYEDCFNDTRKPIILVGSSSKLAALAATTYNGNVTVG